MTKILGTGLSGLVGSRIVELLSGKYTFDSSIEDITDKDLIQKRIKTSDAPIVLHLAAKTDVDGCEEDKEQREQGETWKVNVLGTKNIVDGCLQGRKKLIYISTDFVFDGEKIEPYTEDDKPNPINWYGKTKHEGEKIISNSGLKFFIARIAYPYRRNFEQKKDFARALIGRLKNNEKVSVIIDHIMTPTFIDDIASALDFLIKNGERGIFHVVGSQFLTPYECATLIAGKLGSNKNLISKTTREEYFKNRAPRPFHLALKNDKIRKLGIKMRTFEEGLEEIISEA